MTIFKSYAEEVDNDGSYLVFSRGGDKAPQVTKRER
jgi:hypothetical protein